MAKIASALLILCALAVLCPNNLLAEEKDSAAEDNCLAGDALVPGTGLCAPMELVFWARDMAQTFEGRYGQRFANARPFALGYMVFERNGERDQLVFWYLYSNTDGYIQVCYSTKLDWYEVLQIEEVHDMYGRPYEAAIHSNWCNGGWVGISNDFYDEDDPDLESNFKASKDFVQRVFNRLVSEKLWFVSSNVTILSLLK